MTGIRSLRASSTARCSFLVSTIQTACGVRGMSRMPPRVFSSLSFSRRRPRSSFLVRPEAATSSKSMPSSSLSRWIRLMMVPKLVSMPPSQRWFTNGMPDPGGLLGDGLLGLLLGADEQHLAAAGDGVLDERVRAVDVGQRLLQVDDVDAVALGEDESLHLRVPATGLVPEVDAALEQLAGGDDGHGRFLSLPGTLAPAYGCRHRTVRRRLMPTRHARRGGPERDRWRRPVDRTGGWTCEVSPDGRSARARVYATAGYPRISAERRPQATSGSQRCPQIPPAAVDRDRDPQHFRRDRCCGRVARPCCCGLLAGAGGLFGPAPAAAEHRLPGPASGR